MASCILASGRGCSLDIALGFFNAVASARLLYAVPLVALRPAQWDALDTLHRGVVRCLYGLPRSSPIGPTLAEAGETFLTSGERQCVAPHSPHVPHVRGTTPARRLLDRRHSGMGQRALEYAALVPDPPYCGLLQIPPHQDPGLEIKTTISGISGSPSCAGCPAEETTEHILLQCPGYTEQRLRLFDAYGRLGLPHVSLDHLRFPQAHRSGLMRAFKALLEFFGDAALIARL
ncbi:hypothetical protein MRX96_035319 [Rhipicephalus microplus]